MFFTGCLLNRSSVQPASPSVKAEGIPSVSFSLREVNSLKHCRTGGREGHPEGWWLLLVPRGARPWRAGEEGGPHWPRPGWIVALSLSCSLRTWTRSASVSSSAERDGPPLPQDHRGAKQENVSEYRARRTAGAWKLLLFLGCQR